MKLFRNAPIQRKVTLIIMLTTFLALFTSGVALFFFELLDFRSSSVNELQSLARIVGDNSAAALEFGDKSVGKQILTGLGSDPHIIAASIYGADRAIFASYKRDAYASDHSQINIRPDGVYIEPSRVTVLRGIELNGQRIGTIFIERDWAEFYGRAEQYLFILLGVLGGTLILSLGFSVVIQRLVTKPILELAKATQLVSSEGMFTQRVEKKSEDELGFLISQFNLMLDQIQERDRALIQARAKLEEHVRELARSNADLQQFASVASHDLQQPLRTVSNMVSLLQRHLSQNIDKESAEYMRLIVKGTAKMQELIRDLLEYSRVGTRGGKFALVKGREIFDGAAAQLKAAIEEARMKVICDGLPSFVADPSQMLQVFQNLMSNALQYRTKENPTLHVSASESPDEWIFSFRDNGIGIDPKHHLRIFDMFRRLHGEDEYPGTGMGLAICKRIVQRHGGRIWVESAIGKGATFYVALPKNIVQVNTAQSGEVVHKAEYAMQVQTP